MLASATNSKPTFLPLSPVYSLQETVNTGLNTLLSLARCNTRLQLQNNKIEIATIVSFKCIYHFFPQFERKSDYCSIICPNVCESNHSYQCSLLAIQLHYVTADPLNWYKPWTFKWMLCNAHIWMSLLCSNTLGAFNDGDVSAPLREMLMLFCSFTTWIPGTLHTLRLVFVSRRCFRYATQQSRCRVCPSCARRPQTAYFQSLRTHTVIVFAH